MSNLFHRLLVFRNQIPVIFYASINSINPRSLYMEADIEADIVKIDFSGYYLLEIPEGDCAVLASCYELPA